jgi:hypothetical protein
MAYGRSPWRNLRVEAWGSVFLAASRPSQGKREERALPIAPSPSRLALERLTRLALFRAAAQSASTLVLELWFLAKAGSE